MKYCLRGTRQLYDISEGHGRIPAKSLGITWLARSLAHDSILPLSTECPALAKIILRKNLRNPRRCDLNAVLYTYVNPLNELNGK